MFCFIREFSFELARNWLLLIFFSGATAVCGYHSYWMGSRMSFIPAQSAAPSLVNTVALESIVYGTKRRNIDKLSTITQEANLACPHWNILSRGGTFSSILSRLTSLMKDNVTKENWVGTSLHDWEIFLYRGSASETKDSCTECLDWQILKRLRLSCLTIFTLSDGNCWAWRLSVISGIFFQACQKSRHRILDHFRPFSAVHNYISYRA